MHPDHQIMPHPTVGNVVAVEPNDLLHGVVHAGCLPEQVEIGGAHQAVIQEVFFQEFQERFPVGAARLIDKNDGENPRFAGLHQREHFEAFVQRSKPAGEERDGVGFLHKIEFSGEKIVEVDELGVAVDHRVRPLFERQADVEPKRVVAPGAALGSAHDAVAAAGDEHEAAFAHLASKFLGGNGFGVVLGRAGGAEDDDFVPVGVFRENTGGMAQFAQGTVEQLEVGLAQSVAPHLERRDDHLLDKIAGRVAAVIANKVVNPLVDPHVADGAGFGGKGVDAAASKIRHSGIKRFSRRGK